MVAGEAAIFTRRGSGAQHAGWVRRAIIGAVPALMPLALSGKATWSFALIPQFDAYAIYKFKCVGRQFRASFP
jgi:hypothetical protein